MYQSILNFLIIITVTWYSWHHEGPRCTRKFSLSIFVTFKFCFLFFFFSAENVCSECAKWLLFLWIGAKRFLTYTVVFQNKAYFGKPTPLKVYEMCLICKSRFCEQKCIGFLMLEMLLFIIELRGEKTRSKRKTKAQDESFAGKRFLNDSSLIPQGILLFEMIPDSRSVLFLLYHSTNNLFLND